MDIQQQIDELRRKAYKAEEDSTTRIVMFVIGALGFVLGALAGAGVQWLHMTIEALKK